MIRVTQYYDRPARRRRVWCYECGVERDFNDTATVEDKVYCYSCAYLVDTGIARICPACRNYFVKTAHLCEECGNNEFYRKIVRQWTAAINRTGDQNNKDAVTLLEWFDTLRHFGYGCVYCPGEYEELEHYVPVARGGRTVAGNCVPACWRCNSMKSMHNPRDFTRADLIEEIENYLRSSRSRHSVVAGIERMMWQMPDIKYWIIQGGRLEPAN